MESYQKLTASQETILKHYLPNNEKIEKIANYFCAYSDNTRLKILMTLCVTSMCVGDLSKILNINQTTLSHQLKFLKNNGLVKAERSKNVINYSVNNYYIEKIIGCGVDASF